MQAIIAAVTPIAQFTTAVSHVSTYVCEIINYFYNLQYSVSNNFNKEPPWVKSCLKSDTYLAKSFNEYRLKMIKNAFYFILKALFVLKIFKFLTRLFWHAEKTAWFMTSQTITIHILPNISWSKDNQTKRINKRNIFLQKSCRK